MTSKPLLVIAASTETFDNAVLQRWIDEGFDVHYEQVYGGSRSSTFAVEAHGDDLESGERYAIVSYLLSFSLHLLLRAALLIFASCYQPQTPANI